MRSSSKLALGVAALAALGIAVAVLSNTAPKARTETAPETNLRVAEQPAAHVGSAACTGCHSDQGTAWAPSHHALAMQLPSAETVLGAFDGQTAKHREGEAQFSTRDGAFFVRMSEPGAESAEHQVAFTFGVAPLQQYLVSLPGGRLQPLPWAWDTRSKVTGGQRWFHLQPEQTFEPGDPLHWTGYAQTANHTCVECHVTDYDVGYDAAQDTFKSTWNELGVGCESCHGAGSNHVAWAADPKQPNYANGGFANRLGRPSGSWAFADGAPTAAWTGGPRDEAALDTCATCHALRTGFSAQTSTSGPFLDRFMPRLLDTPAYHVDGQIDGEVFVYGSFLQSKMHRAGVTCADCHEPHSLTLRAEGNALCAQCHTPDVFDTPKHSHHPKGTPGAQCVNCHMPAKTYMVVDPRRDHRLAVPRPDVSASLGTPSACTACHTDKSSAWAADEAANWWPKLGERPSFADAIDTARHGDPESEALLVALANDSRHSPIVRASALPHLVGNAEPRTAHRVLTPLLRDADPLVRAAALRALEALPPAIRWREGKSLLADAIRAVRLEAARALAGFAPKDALPEDVQRLARAVSELEAAERANGSRPENRLNLSNLYARMGRGEDAERELRAALRLDPHSIPARINLADVLRAKGAEADAERLLREAVAIDPKDASAQHALGLLLIRRKQRSEALEHLAKAYEHEDPLRVRFAYVYAVALRDAGNSKDARRVLEAAHGRRATDRGVLWLLIQTCRDQEDVAAAREHAAALLSLSPEDPQVQRVGQELR